MGVQNVVLYNFGMLTTKNHLFMSGIVVSVVKGWNFFAQVILMDCVKIVHIDFYVQLT